MKTSHPLDTSRDPRVANATTWARLYGFLCFCVSVSIICWPCVGRFAQPLESFLAQWIMPTPPELFPLSENAVLYLSDAQAQACEVSVPGGNTNKPV